MVEQWTENPRVPSSILGLGTTPNKSSRSGGMVDAAVSKTVEGQLSCRFESDLRHKSRISVKQSPFKHKNSCQANVCLAAIILAKQQG